MRTDSTLPTRRKGAARRLGERLQKLRADRDWSVSEVSRRTGLSWDMICTVEGRNPRRATEPWNVSVATAIALVAAFYPDLSLADFFPPSASSTGRKRLTEETPAA